MAKKKTRLEKSTAILNDSKAIQWCYVNADNEFKFMDKIFVIDEKVEEYKVYNKYNVVENYTNEAYMEEILVVIDNKDSVYFYNQNYDMLEAGKISIKE